VLKFSRVLLAGNQQTQYNILPQRFDFTQKLQKNDIFLVHLKPEYSLRESVSAQGREGCGFDSDPGRNLKKIEKKKVNLSIDILYS
jgi:hypothetical protein